MKNKQEIEKAVKYQDWKDTCDWKYDNYVNKIKIGKPIDLE